MRRSSAPQTLIRRSLAFVGALALVVAPVPMVSLTGSAAAATTSTNPVQISTNLEGCKRPAPATACAADGSDFVNGNLGKNWNELDLVPHRVILTNNHGATETFGIQIAADYMHASGDIAVGYDLIKNVTTPSCVQSVGAQERKTNIIGGAYQTITREVVVSLADHATCTINWDERLAIGSHLFSGSSLQSQILNDDYSSLGQETISIPVKDVKPQTITVTDASASHVTDYSWSVSKSGSGTVDINSCDPAPTSPNVSYTVSYTKAAISGGSYHVTGTINLGNPSSRALTTDTISVTVTDASRDTSGTPLTQHVTVPAATDSSSGTLVPGAASTTFSANIPAPLGSPVSVTATATYQDPDNPGQVLAALTSASSAVSVSVHDTDGLGTSATITDHEQLTSGASGLSFKRTTDPAMTTFATDNSFDTSVSDSGSFDISKIVKATQKENLDGTLANSVSLVRSGQTSVTDTASADPITIHVTAAKPKLTLTKSVDLAPTSDATFSFTITSKDDANKFWTTSVTVLAGETSGSSSKVTVDPSASGYTVTETASAPGYNTTDPTQVGALGLCDDSSTAISDARTLGHVTVTKALSGPVAGASTVFHFTVTCPGMDDISLTVDTSKASSASTDDVIPTGVVCTITEQTPPAGWTDTSSDPSSGQATSGAAEGGDTVTITNTRDLDHVTVTKALSGPVAGAGTSFTFDVSCAASGQTFTLTVDPINGPATASTPDTIPTGVVCTITEQTPPAGWTDTSSNPADGTATSGAGGGGDTVTVTNTRVLGHITVVKQFSGTVTATDRTFAFTVTCPGLAPIALTVNAAISPSASTADVIPTGVVCTVTEQTKDGWRLVSTQAANGTATAATDNSGTVTFVNAQRTGTFTITKSVDQATAPVGATLTYHFDVAATGDLTQHNVVVKDILPGHDPLNPGSAPVTFVAGSATCSITCTASYDPATFTVTWSLGDLAPGTTVGVGFQATIDGPAQLTVLTVDNTGSVSSSQTPPVVSNTVVTTVPAVLAAKVTRAPKKIAYTGLDSGLPIFAGLLLLTGMAVLRRRSA